LFLLATCDCSHGEWGVQRFSIDRTDTLSQIYFGPPYFPSLDDAKTLCNTTIPELEEGETMRDSWWLRRLVWTKWTNCPASPAAVVVIAQGL